MSKLHAIVAGSVSLLLLWLFAPALTLGQSFAFRDSAHFYHPLFRYLAEQWGAGGVPLWNPAENAGMPLVGENTSSVFYPGKLLFAMPLDYTAAYNWYVVAHVALAAAGAWWLARHFQASVLAGGVAALAYAFGGSVLFQYCNVVFLVGAAWLPWSLWLADRALGMRSWPSACGFGIVLALMITGGDPQMAYHAGLLAALDGLLLWRTQRLAGAEASRSSHPWRGSRPALLAFSAVTCLALAAVQIGPTWEAAQASGRGMSDAPRNIYEMAAQTIGPAEDSDPDASWYRGLIDASGDRHGRATYQFSVGPWRAIELVWPNVAGRYFPVQSRWMNGIPAEGRVWSPSLYLGLLPIALAFARIRLTRRAAVDVRWCSWMMILGAAASLGTYGLGWLAREVMLAGGASRGLPIGDEVGGLYWLMNLLLPGYVYFRYPAKLMVIFGLGASLLAARGWDALWAGEQRGPRRWLLGLALTSAVGLPAVTICWPMIASRLETIPADPLFGPFDVEGARRDILFALAQTAVLAGLLLVALRSAGRAGQGLRVAVWLSIALDLALAQGWLISYAPADAWQGTPEIAASLPADRHNYRVFRQTGPQPAEWLATPSNNRLAEAVRWDRQTLWPKYALPEGISLVEASSTIAARDYQVLLDVARRHIPSGKSPLPHDSVLDLLSARVAIVGADVPLAGATPLPLRADGMRAFLRPTALPRAWIVHQVEQLPELVSQSTRELERRTREVLFPENQPRDWRHTAVVESNAELPRCSLPGDASAERCEIVRAEPTRVEIEAVLSAPGLVILGDRHAPGWKLSVESSADGRRTIRTAPILRTNRVLRGAWLPAGEHRLIYEYRPASFRVDALISGISLIAILVAAGGSRWRRQRLNRPVAGRPAG